MPATNEEFIKKAFESGLSEDQVRAAVVERNKLKGGQAKTQDKGLLYNLLVAPYERTAKNIGAAAVTGPQAAIAGSFQKVADNPYASKVYEMLGLNPQDIATKIANVQVGDTQKQAQYVAENPLKAGGQQLLDSLDIALQAKTLSSGMVKNAATKGKGVVKTVANPKKAVVNARNTAATGKKIHKAKLLKDAEKIAVDNPGAKREFENVIKPQLEKINDAGSLLKKIDRWNKKAFLRGGGMKSSHAADLYGDVLNLLRGELKRVAPEAAKYQKVLQLGHTVPKMVSKTSWQGAKLAGLAKLLGIY